MIRSESLPRWRRYAGVLLVSVVYNLLLYAGVIHRWSVRIGSPDEYPINGIVIMLFISLWMAWGGFIQHSILDPALRRRLMSISACMVAYSFIQFSKYNFFKEENLRFIVRYCRYLYQVPSTLIPLLLFLASLGILHPEKPNGKWTAGLWIAWSAMCAVILTNDLHRWAMIPLRGYEVDYDRARLGPVVVASYIWDAALLVGALAVCLRCTRLRLSRRRMWIPLVCLGAGCGLMLLQILVSDSYFERILKRTDLYNITIIAFVESLIATGLIPSNTGYSSIFRASTVSAQIADATGRVVLRSRSTLELSDAAMQAAKHGQVRLDEDTRLRSREIAGGRVYWIDDISRMNRVHEQLAEASKQLEEAGELIQAENELKKERARIDTQRRIYDEIAEATRGQMRRMAQLAEDAHRDASRTDAAMRGAMICLVYIKRRSNLALLAEQTRRIPVAELRLSLSESVFYLHYSDVPGMVSGTVEGSLDAAAVLAAYELFQEAVERALPGLSGVIALLSEDGDGVGLELQLGTPSGEPDWRAWEARLSALGAGLRVCRADDTLRVMMALSRAGIGGNEDAV